MGIVSKTTAQVEAILNGQHTFTDGSDVNKDIMRVVNSNSDHAPFVLVVGDHPFNGMNDYWMFWGYNFDASGNPIDATEQSLAWGMESSYHNGIAETFEHYLEWRSPNGCRWARPIELCFNKETGQMISAILQMHFIRFKRWDDTGVNPLQTFATLSACDEETAAPTYPAFRLLGLADQTAASEIGVSAGNGKESKLYVQSQARVGYFETVVGGVQITETTNGSIYLSTGGAVSVEINRYGKVTFTGKIVQTQITAALTDGAPTATEINAATGITPSTAGAGWQCTIKDTSGSGLLYRIESDGTSWFYTVMSKAV